MRVFKRKNRMGSSFGLGKNLGLGKIGKLIGDGVATLKDFGVTADGDAGWQRMSGGSSSMRYPGSDIDWEAEAGPLWLNPAVAICLQYVIDKIAEPDICAVRQDAAAAQATRRKRLFRSQRAKRLGFKNDTLIPDPGNPVTELLTWANEEYRGRQLLAGMAMSYKLDGNAYAVKVRGPGGLGKPQELWWVPHWRMTPLAPLDGGPTQFYVMLVPQASGNVIKKLVSRANVIHVRNGLDPLNPRKGLATFKAMFRGVVSDNEFDTYTAIILRNMGVIGAMVSPSNKDDEISEEQAEELKRRMQNETRGDNRGGVIVPNVPVDVQFATRSPQDMALSSIGDRPQARICAAFGVDPLAVGLSSAASGKGEKYGALRKEARESSMEQGILPMLSVFAEAWTQEMLPDFLYDTAETWMEYDYSGVRDMQPDVDAEHKRAREDFQANGITLDEYRGRIGEEPCADAELGEKFNFQLLAAPMGAYGVIPAPGQADETQPKTPANDVIPGEEDEDNE